MIFVLANNFRKPFVLFSVVWTTIPLNAVGVTRLQRVLFTDHRVKISCADIAT